jgi:hypothetical protein
MEQQETNSGIDAAIVALRALGWTLDEPKRAERLLALTGLTAGELRGRLGDVELLAAVLRFLEAHEPDLVACATALAIEPAGLVAARRRLEA